ncbi:MAG: hypothetical protein ACE5EG_08050 [Thermoanaerobaculia bacterium]
MFELKPLSQEALPGALDKAVRYRLLNEPMQAESICRDVLRVDPENRQALINLVLSLTDQFAESLSTAFGEAKKAAERLSDEYDRCYYRGIICERRANAHHSKRGPGSGTLAYDWYRQAMELYERAGELAPTDNADAALRWNTCVRMLRRHSDLKPQDEEVFHPMLE